MVEKCARTGCRKLTFNLNSLSRLQLSLNGPPCRWYRRQVAYTCTPNTGHRGNAFPLPLPLPSPSSTFSLALSPRKTSGFLHTRRRRTVFCAREPVDRVCFPPRKFISKINSRSVLPSYLPLFTCHVYVAR